MVAATCQAMLTQLSCHLLCVLPSQAVHNARLSIRVLGADPVHHVLDLLRSCLGLGVYLRHSFAAFAHLMKQNATEDSREQHKNPLYVM